MLRSSFLIFLVLFTSKAHTQTRVLVYGVVFEKALCANSDNFIAYATKLVPDDQRFAEDTHMRDSLKAAYPNATCRVTNSRFAYGTYASNFVLIQYERSSLLNSSCKVRIYVSGLGKTMEEALEKAIRQKNANGGLDQQYVVLTSDTWTTPAPAVKNTVSQTIGGLRVDITLVKLATGKEILYGRIRNPTQKRAVILYRTDGSAISRETLDPGTTWQRNFPVSGVELQVIFQEAPTKPLLPSSADVLNFIKEKTRSQVSREPDGVHVKDLEGDTPAIFGVRG